MSDNECRELVIQLDQLRVILKASKDPLHRAALEKIIIYLGNRLVSLLEDGYR